VPYDLAGLVPSDVRARYADPAVLGQAQDAQVEQRVMESTAGQRVRHLIGALMAFASAHEPARSRRDNARGHRRTRTSRTDRPPRAGPPWRTHGDGAATERCWTLAPSSEGQGGHVKVGGSVDQLGHDQGGVRIHKGAGDSESRRPVAVPRERAGDRPPLVQQTAAVRMRPE